MKTIFLFILCFLFSCSENISVLDWNGCYKITIGNTWHYGNISMRGNVIFIGNYECIIERNENNSITAKRVLQANGVVSTTEFVLTNYGEFIQGVVIKTTTGADCDTQTIEAVYMERVPCKEANG